MATSEQVRPPSLVVFAEAVAARQPGVRISRARGQNFLVDWIAAEAGAAFLAESAAEAMLLLPAGGARIEGPSGALDVPGRRVCILPPGAHCIAAEAGGVMVLLRSAAPAAEYATAANAAAYDPPDPRVAAPGAPWRRQGGGIAVVDVDRMAVAAGRPRLKMLQSATMSINWVEYEGVRDRTQLSPHSHEDFEQGSLAILGGFVHHLRVPWGPDATLWRDDLHMAAPGGSLAIVPPGLIHTTEGEGPERHLLIDVFCPPRADFIAKGWVANSGDYAPP
jgi:hypothetical protein